MCGIVGLFLKDPALEPRLGSMLAAMLGVMSDRGPDSAGFAVYGKGEPDRVKLTVRGDRLDGVAAALGESGLPTTLRDSHMVISLPAAKEEWARDWLASERPDLAVTSAGQCIEIYKEVGLPTEVAKRFDLAGMSGTHGVGHTRMATESAVTTAGAHPFSTGADQCLVHNGSLSNHRSLRRVLEPACAQAAPGRSLVLDVGSNSGMYGLMAIAAGCPAIFFDLQPGCNKVVTGALLANGWTDRGLVVAGGLSETSGTVKVSSAGTCDMESGRFPLNVQEAGTADEGDVSVPTEPLATFIGPDTRILLMKVDTEGFEQRVLAGCMPYFERRLVKHVIVEVTPGHKAWETRGIDVAEVAATFERIVRAGYAFTFLGSAADVNAGNGTRMTDPVAVRDWVLARGVGQRDVLLSLM